MSDMLYTLQRYLMAAALTLVMATTLQAQDGDRKFSPKKFEADLEAFITKEAALTPQEATKFFTLFREMRQKQRTIYGRIKHYAKQPMTDDAAAERAIDECDKLQIELKEIEQKYHQRMVREVSAVKVAQAIKAESRFHRRMMKGMQKRGKRR